MPYNHNILMLMLPDLPRAASQAAFSMISSLEIARWIQMNLQLIFCFVGSETIAAPTPRRSNNGITRG